MASIFALNFSRQTEGLRLNLSRHISSKMMQLFLRTTSVGKGYCVYDFLKAVGSALGSTCVSEL